ncbi:MAG: TetR/AcrR family transcriptional regulator [Lachnospiraceae bacterium]
MKLTGKEDIRIRRSILSIRRAFEEMVCEMDYQQITVTELAARAMINKKTFYQYYPSLDDLLREVQMELSEEYAKRIQGLGLQDMHRLVEEFYLFSEEKGPFYEKITCGNSYAAIRQTMIDNVKSHAGIFPEFEKLSKPLQNILGTYMNTVMLQLYSQWIADKKQIPVRDMIDLTTDLITQGIQNFMK